MLEYETVICEKLICEKFTEMLHIVQDLQSRRFTIQGKVHMHDKV